MDAEKYKKLNELILTAKELGEPVTYFFDHFADHQEFIAQGKRTKKAPVLATLLKLAVRELFEKKIVIRRLALIHLKKENLVHGNCQINGHMAFVLYLTDHRVGILVLHGSGEAATNLIRFTHSGLTNSDGEAIEMDESEEILSIKEIPIPYNPSPDSVS